MIWRVNHKIYPKFELWKPCVCCGRSCSGEMMHEHQTSTIPAWLYETIEPWCYTCWEWYWRHYTDGVERHKTYVPPVDTWSLPWKYGSWVYAEKK